MKCFERLVKDHITSTLPDTLDPLQFAYRPNRSTDDAIAIVLHTILFHVEKRNTYVRMLLIDLSLAFNTIVPSKLIIKLRVLGLNPALCNRFLDFQTCHTQMVKVGNNTPHKGECSPPSCTPCSTMTACHAHLQLNQVFRRHNISRPDYQQ